MTFLFTGVEDYPRLRAEDPSDLPDGLRVHDGIVRDAIESHGGYVFGTDGSGLGAAFSTATRHGRGGGRVAGGAAEAPVVGFAVRMGLHTGEASELDRTYFGTEVNRAARLMSLAHGGQVVVSDTTEMLLRDRCR